MTAYLVTGGAGFIGSHTVEALLRSGASVRVLDDLSSGRRENLAGVADRIAWLEADVCDAGAVAAAVRGVDVVVHLAALVSVPQSVAEPERAHAVNATATLSLLCAARQAGVRRVVIASSSAVYGDAPGLPKREDMPIVALSPYAAGKAMGEHYATVFSRTYGLPVVCLRYFNVYGPRQRPDSDYAAVVPRFADRLLRGLRPTIYGDGSQTRDFVGVDDVAAANLRACVAPVAGGVFNVASGRRTSVRDLLAAMVTALGRAPDDPTAQPEFVPERAGDVPHSVADVSAARDVLGFEAHTPLVAGLGRTLAWFSARSKEAHP